MQNTNQPTSVTNNQAYNVTPLFAAMSLANNKYPKNSLPIDTEGTIQSNADQAALPDVTLYNAHGILVNSRPNSLIATA